MSDESNGVPVAGKVGQPTIEDVALMPGQELTCAACPYMITGPGKAIQLNDAETGLKRHFHGICFWRTRCQGYEQMLMQEHQTFAAAIVARGGRITISPRDQAKAKELNFAIKVDPLPNGQIVVSMPVLVVVPDLV